MRGEVDASRVPAAAQAPAFRRITRPQRPLMRRLAGGGTVDAFQQGLVGRAERRRAMRRRGLHGAAEPRARRRASRSRTSRRPSTPPLAALAAEPPKPRRLFLELAQADLAARRARGEDLASVDGATLGGAISTALDARIPQGRDGAQRDPSRCCARASSS